MSYVFEENVLFRRLYIINRSNVYISLTMSYESSVETHKYVLNKIIDTLLRWLPTLIDFLLILEDIKNSENYY